MEKTTTETEPAIEGSHYVPGTPVPNGYQIVTWDNGVMTLQKKGDPGYDPELRQKVLLAVDQAYTKLRTPTDEHPEGRIPTQLLVNVEFRRLFRNVREWGDPHPAAVILERDERKFTGKDAVTVGEKTQSRGPVKFRFSFDELDDEDI